LPAWPEILSFLSLFGTIAGVTINYRSFKRRQAAWEAKRVHEDQEKAVAIALEEERRATKIRELGSMIDTFGRTFEARHGELSNRMTEMQRDVTGFMASMREAFAAYTQATINGKLDFRDKGESH
jgi:hypothetical protein